MLIDKKVLSSCLQAIDKKDCRQHLRAVCFDYDNDTGILTIVGTNAQIMIVNKIAVDKSFKDLCNKFFNYRAYFIPEEILKISGSVVEFIDADSLYMNGYRLDELDTSYPNYKAVIPTKDLQKAEKYTAFNPEYLKRAAKALGYKDATSMMVVKPLCQDADSALVPYIWKETQDGFESMAIVMPLRVEE